MRSAQHMLNLRAIQHPRVGDKWYDHGVLQLQVIKITALYIHVKTGNGKIEQYTPTEFKNHMLYDTIPDRTWADVET